MRVRPWLCAFALAAGAVPAEAASDNNVTRWVDAALATVRAVNLSTPAAARLYAMTTAAMYDAVNGIEVARGWSARRHAVVPPEGAPWYGDPQAAAAAAAHAVLVSFVPAASELAQALDDRLDEELRAVPQRDAGGRDAGRQWGAYVGGQVRARRSDDGTQVPDSLPAGTAPGEFRAPFNGAQFRHMRPFAVASVAPYLSAGPPPLASAPYAAAWHDVRTLGAADDADEERAAIARHWQAEAGTVRETGLWLKAALDVARRRGTAQSLSGTARLFAMLGMGIADAVAVSWTAKYDGRFWRPADAIREAHTDGNAATEPDPGWQPRHGSPGGTPEYTSGTSTFAGAASTILAGFYCTDRVHFSFAGELGTQPRRYRSFSAAADEAGRSRIYNGIHFEFSNRDGRRAGNAIGRDVVSRFSGGCRLTR